LGIQNHTVAIAAPVSNEAVGTTPMLRAGAATGSSTAAGAGVASGLMSVTATMSLTYGPHAVRDTAFSREPAGENPPHPLTDGERACLHADTPLKAGILRTLAAG
jgi:hypothetical protein